MFDNNDNTGSNNESCSSKPNIEESNSDLRRVQIKTQSNYNLGSFNQKALARSDNFVPPEDKLCKEIKHQSESKSLDSETSTNSSSDTDLQTYNTRKSKSDTSIQKDNAISTSNSRTQTIVKDEKETSALTKKLKSSSGLQQQTDSTDIHKKKQFSKLSTLDNNKTTTEKSNKLLEESLTSSNLVSKVLNKKSEAKLPTSNSCPNSRANTLVTPKTRPQSCLSHRTLESNDTAGEKVPNNDIISEQTCTDETYKKGDKGNRTNQCVKDKIYAKESPEDHRFENVTDSVEPKSSSNEYILSKRNKTYTSKSYLSTRRNTSECVKSPAHKQFESESCNEPVNNNKNFSRPNSNIKSCPSSRINTPISTEILPSIQSEATLKKDCPEKLKPGKSDVSIQPMTNIDKKPSTDKQKEILTIANAQNTRSKKEKYSEKKTLIEHHEQLDDDKKFKDKLLKQEHAEYKNIVGNHKQNPTTLNKKQSSETVNSANIRSTITSGDLLNSVEHSTDHNDKSYTELKHQRLQKFQPITSDQKDMSELSKKEEMSRVIASPVVLNKDIEHSSAIEHKPSMKLNRNSLNKILSDETTISHENDHVKPDIPSQRDNNLDKIKNPCLDTEISEEVFSKSTDKDDIQESKNFNENDYQTKEMNLPSKENIITDSISGKSKPSQHPTIQEKRGTLVRVDSISSPIESAYSSTDNIPKRHLLETKKKHNGTNDIPISGNFVQEKLQHSPGNKNNMRALGTKSKYKSIANINTLVEENELALLPIKPPRRSKSEMSNIKSCKEQQLESKIIKKACETPEKPVQSKLQHIQPTVTACQKEKKYRQMSVYLPDTKITTNEAVKRYLSETQLTNHLESTDNFKHDFLERQTEETIMKVMPKYQNMSSKKPIARAKSDRYLVSANKPLKKPHEQRPMALSMNALSQRTMSMMSGMTEGSATMSELELSTCSSEQTVFSTTSRGTVLRKRPEEDPAERWIKDIIASQGNFHLQGLLTCELCKQLFHQPQTVIGCLHSFCKTCLEHTEYSKIDNTIGLLCPLCGIFTNQDNIKENLFFNELLDIHKLSLEGVSSTCKQCPDGVEPLWKCMDCKLDLCDKCHTIHLNIPLLQSHKIVKLTDVNDMIVDRLVFCKTHPDEPIKFNCKDCETIICIKCKVTQHDTHKIETPDHALKRVLPELYSNTEYLEQNLQNLRAKIKEVDYKTEVTKNMYEKCHDDIDNKAEEEIARIRNNQNQLKDELNVHEDIEIAALNQFMCKLQQKQNEGNNLRDLVTISIMRGRQISLLAEVLSGLFHHVKEYRIEIQKETSIQTAHPKLNPNTKVNSLFEEGFLGKINYHTIKVLSSGTIPSYKRFMAIKFEEYFTNPLQKVFDINLPDQCLSISLINDQIWAAFPYLGTIQIYTIYGDLVGNITLEGIQPRVIHQTCEGDVIMACQFTGLYILESESGKLTSKITNGKFSDVCIRDDRIFALEYNTKHVIVFCKGDMSTSNCCGGKWKQSAVVDISKAQQIDSVSTLLIHEQYDDHIYIGSYNLHSIFHFNQRGELIGQYGRKGRNIAGELYYPMLCSIDKVGFLLLADGENKRMQILDIWGMWRSIQLEGLNKPYNVTMDAKQSLWVTQFNDQFHTWQLIKYSNDNEY